MIILPLALVHPYGAGNTTLTLENVNVGDGSSLGTAWLTGSENPARNGTAFHSGNLVFHSTFILPYIVYRISPVVTSWLVFVPLTAGLLVGVFTWIMLKLIVLFGSVSMNNSSRFPPVTDLF